MGSGKGSERDVSLPGAACAKARSGRAHGQAGRGEALGSSAVAGWRGALRRWGAGGGSPQGAHLLEPRSRFCVGRWNYVC